VRVLGVMALAIALLGASACIDAARVNGTCTWSDSVARTLDLARQPDRDHLRQDAQIAWELSVRYGDARYRGRPALARPLRRRCRQALEDTIRARHAVTAADVDTAARSRVWWIDIVLVFVPMAVLAIVATDRITRRLRGAFDAERRVMRGISTSLLVAAVALVAAGVTQYWAMSIETFRLRDGHISDRVTVLPSAAHAGLTFAAAFLACLITAMLRVRGARSFRSPAERCC